MPPEIPRKKKKTHPLLKNLRICNLRVRHVHLTPTIPVPPGPSTTSPSNRLTVAVSRHEFTCRLVVASAAERQDVHAPVAGRTCAERFEDHVRDALRGTGVAGADCRAGRGVDDGALRDDDLDGRHAACRTPVSGNDLF